MIDVIEEGGERYALSVYGTRVRLSCVNRAAPHPDRPHLTRLYLNDGPGTYYYVVKGDAAEWQRLLAGGGYVEDDHNI